MTGQLLANRPPGNAGRHTIGLCFVWIAVATAFTLGCADRKPVASKVDDDKEPPERLSSYGLFQGNGWSQTPAPGVVPYDVNTPLFSDYAHKLRFVRLPEGKSAQYSDSAPFEFPVGTILIKTFAYPVDERDPTSGMNLIETRLIIHQAEGWKGLTYVWNDEHSDAILRIAGADRDTHWIDAKGRERQVKYLVPNTNQCLGCHENRKVMRPIGLTARNLNRLYDYASGRENQLEFWSRQGMLQGAPDPAKAPRLAVWNDPRTGDLEARARAWMESNCAHCHNPDGPARTSGLDLTSTQQDLFQRGFWKPPVAAGRGSGGRAYGIVPGRPDDSILVHRIESREPGVMMPELARRLVDEDGVALVRAWIASLPKQDK